MSCFARGAVAATSTRALGSAKLARGYEATTSNATKKADRMCRPIAFSRTLHGSLTPSGVGYNLVRPSLNHSRGLRVMAYTQADLAAAERHVRDGERRILELDGILRGQGDAG